MGELAPCSARRIPSPVCAEFGSLFRYIFDPKWQCGIRGNSYLLCCCCCCCCCRHRMTGYPCIANNRLCMEKVTRRHTGVSEFGTWKMLKSGASSPTYITTLCQRHKDGALKAKNEASKASFQSPLLLARGLAAKSGQVWNSNVGRELNKIAETKYSRLIFAQIHLPTHILLTLG